MAASCSSDYTNLGDDDGKSHLVGAFIDPQDLA